MRNRLHIIYNIERLRIVFLLLLCAFTLGAKAAGQPDFYRRFMSIPSEKLFKMAGDFQSKENLRDSAVVCYTIIGRRYSKDIPDKEKRLCARAYLNLWYIYFDFYDFDKLYEALIKAKDIFEDLGEENATLYSYYGIFYMTIANESHDKTAGKQALDYLKKAFNISTEQKDASTYDIVFSNLVTVAATNDLLGSITNEWETYRKLPKSSPLHLHDYNELLYKGILYLQKKRYSDAYHCFMHQLDVLPKDESYNRYHYIALTNAADAQAGYGDYQGAIATMRRSEAIAEKSEIKDMRMEVYEILADYLKVDGQQAESDRYMRHYYELKDSVLSAKDVARAKDFEFLFKMDKVEKQLDEKEQQRRLSHAMTAGALLVVVIVAGFAIILWRKNRQLNDRNRELYARNRELLDVGNEPKIESQEKKDSQKYKNSSLKADDKEQIMNLISEVMANTDEICSQQFSATRLAELTGYSYPRLSQVINERYKCNFNMLLNRYRIREACRKIEADPKHLLTIEALANEVGFKSRSTFTTAFKHFTGLTPTEYIRLSKENRVAPIVDGAL